MDGQLCFWCGERPGTPAQPGKIPLCPECEAELQPRTAAQVPATPPAGADESA